MNDLEQRLKKQSGEIRNKMQLLILIKREFERDAKFSLGIIKRIVRYYPELLYLFKENAGWISSNVDKELLMLKEQLKNLEKITPFKIIDVEIEDCKILWNFQLKEDQI
ncbi:TPA: hypothetical protein I9089_002345 [Clostridium perfringens]|nr:hypothetical protein [Clostridium perfringens]